MRPLENKHRRRGTTIIEFVLITAFVLLPLLMGGMVVGFNLVRATQANQVNRDAGHMFARGVDFSTSESGLENRAVLTYLAPRLADSSASGTGVVILSELQYVGPNTFPQSCANVGQVVFLQQIEIGNAALLNSHFGMVPAGSLQPDGSGMVKDPCNDPAAQAHGVLSVLSGMSYNETAYVSEMYFSSTDFDIQGFLKPSGVYCRAIF